MGFLGFNHKVFFPISISTTLLCYKITEIQLRLLVKHECARWLHKKDGKTDGYLERKKCLCTNCTTHFSQRVFRRTHISVFHREDVTALTELHRYIAIYLYVGRRKQQEEKFNYVCNIELHYKHLFPYQNDSIPIFNHISHFDLTVHLTESGYYIVLTFVIHCTLLYIVVDIPPHDFNQSFDSHRHAYECRYLMGWQG